MCGWCLPCRSYCPYCTKAKAALAQFLKPVQFTVIEVPWRYLGVMCIRRKEAMLPMIAQSIIAHVPCAWHQCSDFAPQ